MEEEKSKISYTEWFLVISALFMVDLVQLVLDFFVIGVILNRFIDIFVGMAWALYLQLRGESLADIKRLIGLLTTFVAEEVPGLDALPFWGLDGLYTMSISKGKGNLKKIPGGKLVLSGMERAGRNIGKAQNIIPSPTQGKNSKIPQKNYGNKQNYLSNDAPKISNLLNLKDSKFMDREKAEKGFTNKQVPSRFL